MKFGLKKKKKDYIKFQVLHQKHHLKIIFIDLVATCIMKGTLIGRAPISINIFALTALGRENLATILTDLNS